jgi:uncharacterized membrane protein YccC
MLTGARKDTWQRRERVHRGKRPHDARDALITLRANLSLESTACRHALRLAATLAIAAGLARSFGIPRGYWLPLTVAVMLKPDFHDTFAVSLGRIAGTVVGAVGATAIAHLLSPGPVVSTVLVLTFAWVGYATAGVNTIVFAMCITGYVVFVLTLAGVPETVAALARSINTLIAGGLALGAYAAWPSWMAKEVRPAVATMLDEQGTYLGGLLAAYADAAPADMAKLGEMRASARRARSNAEAVIERASSEPRRRQAIRSSTASGLLAANRRIALASLGLHAGLERDGRDVAPGMSRLAAQAMTALRTLATAVRDAASPAAIAPLRQTQLELPNGRNEIVIDETDLIVDGVETIADLLRQDARPEHVTRSR